MTVGGNLINYLGDKSMQTSELETCMISSCKNTTYMHWSKMAMFSHASTKACMAFPKQAYSQINY
jgi:hypothetical protein